MARIVGAVMLALAALLAGPAWAQEPQPPLVLAAASLQESMNAVADAWARRGHPRPTVSFAGSSALARQVEAGAPADLFVSADEEWMDELDRRGLLVPGTRTTFLGNRLVVVARAGTHGTLNAKRGQALAAVLARGPLAMADVNAVPAGKYGKAALTALGAWDAVAAHVVQAENVRAALALVERGAAPYGVVYATDAKASGKVRVAGVFPDRSHAPILYPVARLKSSSSPEAEGFRRFLVSRAGKAVFARFGFVPH